MAQVVEELKSLPILTRAESGPQKLEARMRGYSCQPSLKTLFDVRVLRVIRAMEQGSGSASCMLGRVAGPGSWQQAS